MRISKPVLAVCVLVAVVVAYLAWSGLSLREPVAIQATTPAESLSAEKHDKVSALTTTTPVVSTAIRDAARDYFAYEIKVYRDGASATLSGTQYNDIIAQGAAEHSRLKTVLAKLIDAELQPLVDLTTGGWKDKKAGALAWGLVAESLRAGMQLAVQ